MRIGKFDIYPVSDGFFKLDGGAMFGIVPKTVWERSVTADEKNRITLGLGCLLVRCPSQRWVLVDTGLGSKHDGDRKFLRIYGVDRRKTLFQDLEEHGVKPSDVAWVVNTHLHFDHAGGNTVREKSGKAAPAFPNAKYLVQRPEWEDATNLHERSKASYLPENYLPLKDSRRLEIAEGEFEIEPGIKAIFTGGHTRGHQCVLIESEGKGALFLGDLVPTRAHLPLLYTMSYDLFPLETIEAKRRLLGEAMRRRWLVVFQHDPGLRTGYIEEKDGRFSVVPAY